MNAAASNNRRITIHYGGHVQGVGFRYTTCSVAGRFDVTGYVKNLPNGCVEMVAEGESAELDAFRAAVAEAMEGYIRSADASESPGTGEFLRFGVAH